MEKKEATKIVNEMSPKMFLSGLEGVLRSGNYKTIEFRVTCDNGDAQKHSKEQINSAELAAEWCERNSWNPDIIPVLANEISNSLPDTSI